MTRAWCPRDPDPRRTRAEVVGVLAALGPHQSIRRHPDLERELRNLNTRWIASEVGYLRTYGFVESRPGDRIRLTARGRTMLALAAVFDGVEL